MRTSQPQSGSWFEESKFLSKTVLKASTIWKQIVLKDCLNGTIRYCLWFIFFIWQFLTGCFYLCVKDILVTFSAGPGLGQIRFSFIVVVVEQAPNVNLLVIWLRICGSHPIPWNRTLKQKQQQKQQNNNEDKVYWLTCIPPLPLWLQSWSKPPSSSPDLDTADPPQSPPDRDQRSSSSPFRGRQCDI